MSVNLRHGVDRQVASTAIAVMMTLASGTAWSADYSGTWDCPGRGTLTIRQNGSIVTGSASGRPGEDWAARRGGTIRGQVDASGMLLLNWDHGDGTTTTTNSTLSADGRGMAGPWAWFRGSSQIGSGTWNCKRSTAGGVPPLPPGHGPSGTPPGRHPPLQPFQMTVCNLWEVVRERGSEVIRGRWTVIPGTFCYNASWIGGGPSARVVCPLNERADFWSDMGITRTYYRNDRSRDFSIPGRNFGLGGYWEDVLPDGRTVVSGSWRAICMDPNRR
jgi:hypothetical protein